MQLTRRDALSALAGAGIIVGSGAAALSHHDLEGTTDDASLTLHGTLDALVATAEVVYPDDIDGIHGFVETYSLGRVQDRPAYRAGVQEAVATLDEYAELWEDAPFLELDARDRDRLLREMGVHTADPVPDGTDPERVRYYVVNELLYALYTSPTGGKLVGIENPQGHPGGLDSYRRGPP